MKVLVCIAAMALGGLAYAAQPASEFSAQPEKSRWYCVSDAPGNMQSSGATGYGHGQTRREAARRAVEDCGRSGGWQCQEPQCWPE